MKPNQVLMKLSHQGMAVKRLGWRWIGHLSGNLKKFYFAAAWLLNLTNFYDAAYLQDKF
jgi:hypothetical protein